MKWIGRWATALVGAAAMAAVAPIAASAAPDVYATSGGQIANGRLWNTTCEKYSSTVVRCRTDIWASQVRLVGGRYVSVTGWVFNNLTYLPSPRAMWGGNNLGRTATWTAADGRKWRTECDTPATGRGACRSYAWASYVGTANGKPAHLQGWVFNNMVRFSGSGIAPVSTVPQHVLDQSTLSLNGWGPIKLGTRALDLSRLGYVSVPSYEVCWGGSGALAPVTSRGVSVWSWGDPSTVQIITSEGSVATDRGIRAGMTIGQAKAAYGSAFTVVNRGDAAGDLWYAMVANGGRALYFAVEGAPGETGGGSDPIVNSDVIRSITLMSADPNAQQICPH